MRRITAIMPILLTVITIGSSCSQNKTQSNKNPVGYDLNNPVKYDMPSQLLEISGIAFNNGDNTTLYAEQDEEGKIFYFKPGSQQISHAKFGAHGDYEDIAILNTQAVIMRSDGTFFTFPLNEVKSGRIKTVKEADNLLPAGEYEGLHAADNKLYALCKQCKGKNHNKECNGYILNLAADGAITKTGEFTVDVQKIAKLTGKSKLKFHPSALAKNPVTKQWYLLSSVNKLLVVLDERWNVLDAYPLSSKFLQPEGMAFDKQGNLYISNEGDKANNGNVLLFKYTR